MRLSNWEARPAADIAASSALSGANKCALRKRAARDVTIGDNSKLRTVDAVTFCTFALFQKRVCSCRDFHVGDKAVMSSISVLRKRRFLIVLRSCYAPTHVLSNFDVTPPIARQVLE